jgi:hypothetical protein
MKQYKDRSVIRLNPVTLTPDKRVPLAYGLRELLGDTEICKFNFTLFRQQHIGRWKINNKHDP